ncbi:non-ribosomal peptide synthetase [Kutzneria sp. CA-103260]|uniref:non-ribosomal peptide synthetase n=1 Tax=Kutzneria sp. CA-103260 TaxID=2802641 RepID=UPI001BADC6DE|nr:non-ribosomal peptide synthetase [Kutzneria sp. CA-103260]QUQ67486.1 Tyrocidine synthase 3 [Kutzneria sp. CA-103260]
MTTGRSSLDEFPLLVQQQNATDRPVDPDLVITDLVDAAALRHPDQPALRTSDGVAVTYRELRNQSKRMAAWLRAAGVGRGDAVAVLADHEPRTIAAILAVARCGAFYVPLDSRWPTSRGAGVLAALPVAALVVSPVYQELGEEIAQAVTGLDQVLIIGESTEDTGGTVTEPPAAALPTDLLYAITTSGSTGTPKVVGVRHSSVVNLVHWFNERHGVSPGDLLLQVTAYTFDLSVYDIFGVLAAGACLLLLPDRRLAEPDAIAGALLAHPVTLWNSAPSMLMSVLPLVHGRTGGDRRNLRRVFLSGDWVPLSAHGALAGEFPEATLVALGGPTETTVWTNDFVVSEVDPRWPSVPYGHPISNVRCYVLREDGTPCDVGEQGELYVGGACVAAGYLNDPELTAERFLPDPWSPELDGRMYRTGDRVRWTADGWMEFLGRLDNQAKVAGYRIELGEIEYAARSLPGVDEAFAVVVDGQRNRELGLVVRGDARLTEAGIRAGLVGELPSYMLPSVVAFLEHVPLTASGKADRAALGALLARGSSGLADGDAAIGPLSDAAEMARLWTRVLGRAVGVHDHFLEAGGTSLVAMQLIGAMHKDYGVRVSTESLYRAGTPSALAAEVLGLTNGHGTDPSWQQTAAGARVPLSVQQQVILFLETLAPGTVGYNSIAQVRVGGPLDPDRLRAALGAVVARHPVLRTRFVENVADGVEEQRVRQDVVVALDVLDLTADDATTTAQVVRRAGRHVFDLAVEPGIRWLLVREAADRHILVQVEHHFVHDGWSMWVLLQDTATAYRQLTAGEPVDLGSDRVSYADYTRWQQEWSHSEQAERQVEHWLREIGPPAEPLHWPFEERRPPVFPHQGDTCDIRLPAELDALVHEFANSVRATPFAVLMAAYAVLVGEVCRNDTPVIGGGLRNRRLPGIDRTVGMFVNTCAFSYASWRSRTFTELVRSTTSRLAAAMDHQEVPFPLITQNLPTSRDRSRNPVFQTSISMNDWPDTCMDYGPGTTVEVSFPSNGGAKFDLDVIVLPEPDGTRMLWRYSTPLFTAADAEDLVARYFALVADLVAAPDARLGARFEQVAS